MPRLVATNLTKSEYEERRASYLSASMPKPNPVAPIIATDDTVVSASEEGQSSGVERLQRQTTKNSTFANLKGVRRIRGGRGQEIDRIGYRTEFIDGHDSDHEETKIQTDEFGHFTQQSGVSMLQLLLGAGVTEHEEKSKIVTLQDRNAGELEYWE